MQDFLKMVTSQLGVNEGQAKSATGGMLGLLQKNLDGGDFSKLTGMLPGAGDLLKSAAPSGGSGGGGLGGLLGAASGLLGGKLGAAAGALSMFEKSGIGMDKAGSFVQMFMKYLEGQGGGSMVQTILGKLPDLKKLMG